MESVDSVVAIGNIEQITDKGNTRIVSINIEKLNDRKLFFESKIKAYIKNKELKVGDKVSISGTAKKLTYTKNEGCFDYKKYMYSKEIYLNIEANEVKSEKLTLKNYFIKFIDNIRSNIRLTCNRYLPEKNAGITLALVVGEKSELDEDISNIFSQAGLAHIIAISGMHTVYVAYAALVFKKIIGKRKSYILAIIILFLFCNLTNNTESVCRASIMLTLFFLSKILYRKSNSLSNLFISIVLGLIKNPFCIYSPGFILSTAGTFGIITMYEESKDNNSKLKTYIKNQIKLGLAANIILFPIIAKMYNKISLTFLISSSIINFFMTILMPVVFLFGFLGIFNNIAPDVIFKITSVIVMILTSLLLWLAELFSKFSVLNIQVVTPTIFTIITYYLIVYIIIRHKYRKKILKIVISIYICVSIVGNAIVYLDRDLKIYFIDVGQGDCTLIETPYNHRILIDGGGSEDGKNDTVGEKIVVPFLLNKHITKIDYIIISHFDSDHVGGILTVMEKIKVKNIIISKQGEDSENYRKFKNLVQSKKINVIVAKVRQRINIEKNLYFDFLWPSTKLIEENILNNNSIVCKLNYMNFSMLFTGDIEEIAEKQILDLYKNNKKILKSTCLKSAHHGSKTSSTKELIEQVNPKYIFIGVGINNKFGHPNDEVIERYKSLRANLYRTDNDGEIIMKINKDGKITTKKHEK
ncbi:MAG: DNA internalization-related competence protein ComEC/Rec2 [Clostridia bacterium]|nr:DNA internalization-related competence protein ComEC/Rec2 [Clostridia bacterium]